MGDWSATKASVVLAALVRNGWQIVRQRGSHRVLAREGNANYVFAFHDREELGPRISRENRQAYRTEARGSLSGRRRPTRALRRTASESDAHV
jgi:predicted RNA binding protein YcfA (HicA-like mRNA interferase family)